MSELHYVESQDLAVAWTVALAAVVRSRGGRVSPLTVSVTGFDDSVAQEAQGIRTTVDMALAASGEALCGTVASTIFPRSMWNWNGDAREACREQLYSRYLGQYYRLTHICPRNRHGTYFGRLIDYRGEAQQGGTRRGVNQLEHIIKAFGSGQNKTPIRHSALIAAIFDPEVDHTFQPRRGFPCMHEVTFESYGRDGLGVSAFYATQYYANKAYGNLLGLCYLGRFVAQALQRQLVRVNCTASVVQLGADFTKQWAGDLLEEIRLGGGGAAERGGSHA